ncbi:hypothetical protein [Amycolatopsis sp. cmx-4-68]|uniref:hypothetical protein n=1 Tax=Amycolatopsis sp. cmx-4-68 TaxID=2790938 RepID=UPI00397C7A5A
MRQPGCSPRGAPTRWDRHIRRLVTDLRTATGRETAEILLIVVDLPYAAVRRYLAADREVPATLEDIVERAIRSALTTETSR